MRRHERRRRRIGTDSWGEGTPGCVLTIQRATPVASRGITLHSRLIVLSETRGDSLFTDTDPVYGEKSVRPVGSNGRVANWLPPWIRAI